MNKLFNAIKENKSFIVPWIVLGISIIIFASGLTYAYFDMVVNSENESSLKAVATDFVVTLGATAVNVNNLYPIYDTYADTQAHSFDFSVSNESRKMVACYSLELNITAISEALKTSDFKWLLIDNTTGARVSGDFRYISGNKIELISQENLISSETVSYTLKIWLSNSPTVNQNDAMNGSLSSKIVIKAVGDACINRIVNNYAYTGDYQTFTAPIDGVYQIELWGASGAQQTFSSSSVPGTTPIESQLGRGAYTKGSIYLDAGEILYVYVGQTGGGNNVTSFNSGTSITENGITGITGGGSTDIRLVSGNWNDAVSLNSRIMVAAGSGSGYSQNSNNAAAGGLIGYTNIGTSPTAATQTGPGIKSCCSGLALFGVANGTIAGGNGYYAGGGGSDLTGSAGGSSFISGHTGCVAIASHTNNTSQPRTARTGTNGVACTTGTSDNLCSVHYSGKKFINTLMIDGAGYTWTNTKGLNAGVDLIPVPTENNKYYISGSVIPYARITLMSTIDTENLEYIDEGLIMHYDGIQNTSSGHSNSTNTWYDLSGNNNNATLSNFNSTATSGWQNNSLAFDGINDSATISFNASLAPSEYTIELVVKKRAIVNNTRSIVFVKWSGYTIEFNADGAIAFGTSSGSTYLKSSTAMNLDQYYVISATYANNVQKIYVNGNFEVQKTGVSLSHATNSVKIGAYGSSYFYNGNIYSVRMYSRALTSAEVENNYNVDVLRFDL